MAGDEKKVYQIDCYSDVSCQWCFVGHRRLVKALEDPSTRGRPFRLETHFKPFMINAESLPADGQAMTKKELFEKKFLTADFATANRSRIVSEGEGEGIRFKFSEDAKVRQTRPCHRLLAKTYDTKGWQKQAELAERLYSDFNEKELDVADPPVLAKIAAELDIMSEPDARAFLAGDEGDYELDQQLEVAKRFGIESVPFFTVDDERFHFSEAATTKEWFKVFDQIEATM